MYSIAFPDMFTHTTTKLAEDREATLVNLKLALLSFKGELFGDPYFGSNLIKFIYENNNNIVLKDLVIDGIYSAINNFVPQVSVQRSDINITSDGTKLYASIKATNSLNYVTNLYSIKLTEAESE